jgi:hypothetical protein
LHAFRPRGRAATQLSGETTGTIRSADVVRGFELISVLLACAKLGDAKATSNSNVARLDLPIFVSRFGLIVRSWMDPHADEFERKVERVTDHGDVSEANERIAEISMAQRVVAMPQFSSTKSTL